MSLGMVLLVFGAGVLVGMVVGFSAAMLGLRAQQP